MRGRSTGSLGFSEMTITASRHSPAIIVPVVKAGGLLQSRGAEQLGHGQQQRASGLRWSPSRHIAPVRSVPSRLRAGQFPQAAAARGSQNPNNAFERSVSQGGPRLSAAEAPWPAAQLDR